MFTFIFRALDSDNNRYRTDIAWELSTYIVCVVLSIPIIYYLVKIQFNIFLFVAWFIIVVCIITCFQFVERTPLISPNTTTNSLDTWTRSTQTCLPLFDNVICEQNYQSETNAALPSYYEATLNDISSPMI